MELTTLATTQSGQQKCTTLSRIEGVQLAITILQQDDPLYLLNQFKERKQADFINKALTNHVPQTQPQTLCEH